MEDENKSKQELIAELVELRRENARLKEKLENSLPGGNDIPPKTILVVDDNQELCSLLDGMLRSLGHICLEARSTGEALDVFTANKDRIDLVLSDVVMPDGSGHELTEELRKLAPDIKILFMSGYTEDDIVPDVIFKIRKADAGLLQKPFTRRELKEHIQQVFDKK